MKIIEVGDFSYVSYDEENSAKNNGVHLYVPGHLDGEKEEDDGSLTGTCPVPMDDYGIVELSYTQDGISACKRLRLAIVEGTVNELQRLALGDCLLRSYANSKLPYVTDIAKQQATELLSKEYITVEQIEIDRRIRLAKLLIEDVEKINHGSPPHHLTDLLIYEARKLGVIL